MAHDHGGDGAGSTRLTVALCISVSILLAEIIGAILTGSLALVVDAGHLLTDAGGLAVALLATALVRRAPTSRRTWGFGRAEVLAATAQAAVLLAVGLFVLVEGIHRLFVPAPIASKSLLVFGVIGLIGNLAALFVLRGSRKTNFNLRAAFLEVGSDAPRVALRHRRRDRHLAHRLDQGGCGRRAGHRRPYPGRGACCCCARQSTCSSSRPRADST